MGDPVTCEFPDPNGTGDVHQRTTTGLAFWRKRTNTPTFTDGFTHWALTSGGLMTWTGSSIDPPTSTTTANLREPEAVFLLGVVVTLEQMQTLIQAGTDAVQQWEHGAMPMRTAVQTVRAQQQGLYEVRQSLNQGNPSASMLRTRDLLADGLLQAEMLMDALARYVEAPSSERVARTVEVAAWVGNVQTRMDALTTELQRFQR